MIDREVTRCRCFRGSGTAFVPGPRHYPRIAAALTELEQARIRPMSHRDADQIIGMLSRIQSVATSLMCDVTQMLATANAETDTAEVLRQAGRIPTRESKRIAKMARQLADMPNVKERFATGDITAGHVNALANAAEKVGPEAVDTDNTLLEAADRMLPDSLDRHTRKWSDQKLIEGGLDPLQRQRRAREAKMWVEKDTGLGILMAKVPRPQFEHLRQTIDKHYMAHLRRDGTDGLDPDEIRTPKQRLADVVFELVTNRNAATGESITETVGPVPRHILATLTPDTKLAGMIYDRAGRPPWLGRNQRLGNAAQRLAVAVRDGGCFECGAPMHRCELHHIQEWHRDSGRTDVENLVAVCRRHHKRLETNNVAVHRTPTGYQTRPRAGPRPTDLSSHVWKRLGHQEVTT